MRDFARPDTLLRAALAGPELCRAEPANTGDVQRAAIAHLNESAAGNLGQLRGCKLGEKQLQATRSGVLVETQAQALSTWDWA